MNSIGVCLSSKPARTCSPSTARRCCFWNSGGGLSDMRNEMTNSRHLAIMLGMRWR